MFPILSSFLPQLSRKGVKVKFQHLSLIFAIILLSCDNDDYPYAEVPSVILNEFMRQYPEAVDVEFNEVGQNYEVEFEINDRDFKALIGSSGNFLKEKKEIKWDSLPVGVRQTLQKDYGKENIKDPELVREGKLVYYQAAIKRFFKDGNIVLLKTGKKDSLMDYWK